MTLSGDLAAWLDQHEADAVTAAVAPVQGELDQAVADLTQARADLGTARAEVAQLTTDNGTLEAQHAADAETIAGQSTRIGQLTARVADLEAQLAALQQPARTKTLLGMSYGGNTDPSAVESQAGKPISVWRLYYQASEVAKAVTAVQTAGAKGRKVVWASFKLPASWADMGKGLQDAWVKDLGSRLSAAAVTAKVTVCVCLHHEPEGDAPLVDYVAMQKHCLPLLRGLPNVLTSIILTGYPQVYGGGQAGWSLDAVWPGDGLVDVIGVDPYLMYGTWQDYNKTPPMVTSWTPPDATFKVFSDFAKAHGCGWAVAETGETNEAFNAPPSGKDGKGFLAQQVAAANQYGARWWCYFASTLNSRGSWEIDSADATAKRAALVALYAA